MRWSRRGVRVWCVLAVLGGLFAMHGLGSSEAGGCHLSATMTSPVGMQPTAMPDQSAVAPDQPIAASAMRAVAGSMCLFVAPTGWPPLALTLLALVTLAVLAGLGLAWMPGVSGRSPPDSGVSLLRRVCVSRT